MMKICMGGSPCTKWSIAQTKDRETEPSGIGWELFENFVIGLHKYNPDYFLYENNKSMSPAIREQITRELGVEPILTNSALVSAQNRQRLYWTNIPGVTQPEDKGILLRDILESGFCWREKGYALLSTTGGTTAEDMVMRRQRNGVAEPIKCLSDREMEYMAREVSGGRNHFDFGYIQDATKEKGKCLTANISRGVPYNVLCEPVRIGTIESGERSFQSDSQANRVYSPYGKSINLCGNGGGGGGKTGLYAVPVGINYLGSLYDQHSRWGVFGTDGKSPTITASMGMGGGHIPMFPEPTAEAGRCQKNPTCQKQIYEVRAGHITIKDKQYPIKLPDGLYIIRKLTVTECKRLQTVPDSYIFPVSNTQAYKMLGNGWTVDVISHILSFAPGITTREIEAFGMYDGMSCGHIALDKLGATVERYYATEIDKYAIKTTQANYPNTIQLGDAFQVREIGWRVA